MVVHGSPKPLVRVRFLPCLPTINGVVAELVDALDLKSSEQ